MYKSIAATKVWQYMFALQIILVLMPAIVKTDEIPEVSDNEEDLLLADESNVYKSKRNWQSLHGAWGKRMDDMDAMDNGKMVYLPAVPYTVWINSASLTPPDSNEIIYDENIYNDKRGWKKMNVAWGKRRNNENEYAPRASASGAWGKRQSDWHKLKGMWGKRAGPQSKWHRLNQGFGKRSTLALYPEAK